LKVDVAMCTWNSNKPWFERCLASIEREIPVCHFIVVDRFSNDGTVEAIKKFFPEALIMKSDADLGKARQEAIRYIDTEWFVFVDDDIELCSGWFESITSRMTYETGAVAALPLVTLRWLRKYSLYARKMAQELRREWKVGRAIYLSNTLIHTRLVKDWSPPRYVTSYEDALLSWHILDKGHVCLILYNLHVKHHGKWGLRSGKKNLWHYSGARFIGHTDFATKRLIRRLLFSPLKGFYACIRLREPLILLYVILSEFYCLKGWLQWDKHIIWKR